MRSKSAQHVCRSPASEQLVQINDRNIALTRQPVQPSRQIRIVRVADVPGVAQRDPQLGPAELDRVEPPEELACATRAVTYPARGLLGLDLRQCRSR